MEKTALTPSTEAGPPAAAEGSAADAGYGGGSQAGGALGGRPRELSNPGFSLLWASSPGPSGATKLPGIERLGGRALSAVRVAPTKGDGPAGQASAASPFLLPGHLETLFCRSGRVRG